SSTSTVKVSLRETIPLSKHRKSMLSIVIPMFFNPLSDTKILFSWLSHAYLISSSNRIFFLTLIVLIIFLHPFTSPYFFYFILYIYYTLSISLFYYNIFF